MMNAAGIEAVISQNLNKVVGTTVMSSASKLKTMKKIPWILLNENRSYTVLLLRMSKMKNQRHAIKWSIALFWMISGMWRWGNVQMSFMLPFLKNKGGTTKDSLLLTNLFGFTWLGEILKSLIKVQLNQGYNLQIWGTFFICRLELDLHFWGIWWC